MAWCMITAAAHTISMSYVSMMSRNTRSDYIFCIIEFKLFRPWSFIFRHLVHLPSKECPGLTHDGCPDNYHGAHCDIQFRLSTRGVDSTIKISALGAATTTNVALRRDNLTMAYFTSPSYDVSSIDPSGLDGFGCRPVSDDAGSDVRSSSSIVGRPTLFVVVELSM